MSIFLAISCQEQATFDEMVMISVLDLHP